MEQITKQELEKLYYQNTNNVLAEMLDVSKVTLLDMLEKAGIKKKGKGFHKKYKVIK